MATSGSAACSLPRPPLLLPASARDKEIAMDLFHDNPMLQNMRQMLGAFAKQAMRPIAAKHDQEESMPWDLLKTAGGVGMTQTAVLDGRRRVTGPGDGADSDDADLKKPGIMARLSVVVSEEMAWGCAGIALAVNGSGLAASPIA